MALICIPPEIIDSIKKTVINSTDSIARNKKLTEQFGEQMAKEINTLYENSLLLKNQKKSLDKFIDNFTDIGIEKKADLKAKIADRLASRKSAIQDNELLSIAQDIWNKKYGLDIPLEEIQKINTLKREADALKPAMEITPKNSPERMAYGDKLSQISNLIEDIKNPQNKMNLLQTVKDIAKSTGHRFSKELGIAGNIGEAGKLSLDVLTSAIYKSIQASMDISYALRQGFKVLTKNPTIWKENFIKAFEPFKHITSKEAQTVVANKFKASLVSHPLYQQAVDSKLAIGVIEDFFPTALAEKIPILGNIFKASNEAFTIFSQGSRMSLFEDFINTATKNGAKITPELSKDFAYVANSITGRGSLGKFESSSEVINKIFYSGRYISSQIDTFTMPFNNKLSPLAREEAMKSSRNNFAAIGGLMATASLFTEVETDPRSSKFGKMKVPGSKDTWIDLTAGIGSYIVLASKTATQESKSATTDKITKLNSGKFGSTTNFDVVTNWLTGKLSPAPSAAVQVLKGQDYSGKKPTLGSMTQNLVTPIGVGNAYNIFNSEDTATALISTVFDTLGASQVDYSKFNK
jgi:hypothetical protein